MASDRINSGILGLFCASVMLLVSGCESQESLPAIKDSQAKTYSKKFAEAACKRLYECVDEMTGAEVGSEATEIVEICAENFQSKLEPQLKECERWDSKLAKVCLKDMAKAECVRGQDIRADSCDELMDNCGIEDPQQSED